MYNFIHKASKISKFQEKHSCLQVWDNQNKVSMGVFRMSHGFGKLRQCLSFDYDSFMISRTSWRKSEASNVHSLWGPSKSWERGPSSSLHTCRGLSYRIAEYWRPLAKNENWLTLQLHKLRSAFSHSEIESSKAEDSFSLRKKVCNLSISTKILPL